jgi:hypothetical protein
MEGNFFGHQTEMLGVGIDFDVDSIIPDNLDELFSAPFFDAAVQVPEDIAPTLLSRDQSWNDAEPLVPDWLFSAELGPADTDQNSDNAQWSLQEQDGTMIGFSELDMLADGVDLETFPVEDVPSFHDVDAILEAEITAPSTAKTVPANRSGKKRAADPLEPKQYQFVFESTDGILNPAKKQRAAADTSAFACLRCRLKKTKARLISKLPRII